MSAFFSLAKGFAALAGTLANAGIKTGVKFFNYVKDNIKTVQKNGVDLTAISLPPINVSLVAPSGAGKTTLLSTVMKDITGVLPAGFDVRPQSPADAAIIQRFNGALGAAIAGGTIKIDTAVIQGSAVSKKYTYEIVYEDIHRHISVTQPFVLMDIPGGWLDIETRPQAKWEEFLEHLRKSQVLWIPVEAPLLMTAVTGAEKTVASLLMKREAVGGVVHDWAKYRAAAESGEPASVCFAPIKCETYFSQDNTGKKAEEFFKRFNHDYKEIVDDLQTTCPRCLMYYAPVESIGCIKLTQAVWSGSQLQTDYRISPPGAQRKIAGAEALTFTIYQYGAEQIVQGFNAALAQLREILKNPLNSGFDWITGGKIRQHIKDLEEITGYLDKVSGQLREIASRGRRYKYFRSLP